MQKQKFDDKHRKDEYKNQLDNQYKYQQIVQENKQYQNVPQSKRNVSHISDEYLIPGIHHTNTVGSSPMKRGVHHIYTIEPRDYVYNVTSGAGQVSTKINSRKELPAMLKAHVGP